MNQVVQKLYTQSNINLFLKDDLTKNVDKSYIFTVNDLPEDEKPRQKLINHGSTVLSVGELLAVILNVGTKKEGVLEMSSRLLKEYGEAAIINQTDPKKVEKALKIPISKACQIVACFELGRRFYKIPVGKPQFLRTAKQVFEYLKDMRDLPKEHLRGLYLNSHFHVIHDEVISIGSLTANVVHPREVFKPALEYSASAVIIAHNHPSGIVNPSAEDVAITKQLIEAGKILGIHVLDHIIVTKDSFVSVPAEYN